METLIRERLTRYLNGLISLRQFQEWFVPATWNVEQIHDQSAYDLTYDIELKLAEFSNGHLTENQLREELRQIADSQTIEVTVGIHMPMRKFPATSFLTFQFEVSGTLF